MRESRDAMVKVVDSDLDAGKFELELRYYVQFRMCTLRERHETLYPTVMGSIISVLFLKKYGFGIKYPTEVNMPLNKESE